MKARTILPGETLGVFGGGQLGRMFALAARRMGYRVHVFTPEHDSPAGQVADAVTNASYDDDTAVARFAQAVRAATFEFENVPASVGTVSAAHTLVRPRGNVLEIAQDRRNEKRFLASRGFPVPRFAVVEHEEDIDVALSVTGLPAVYTSTSAYVVTVEFLSVTSTVRNIHVEGSIQIRTEVMADDNVLDADGCSVRIISLESFSSDRAVNSFGSPRRNLSGEN